jgi:hypothetical protein
MAIWLKTLRWMPKQLLYRQNKLLNKFVLSKIKSYPSLVISYLSTVNCQLSTINYQLSTINYLRPPGRFAPAFAGLLIPVLLGLLAVPFALFVPLIAVT